jgi:TRAP-type C4-dicarboxylate transport system permease small subunit
MKKVKGLDILKNLDLIIAGGAFVALVAITFFGVVMRYVFSNPFTWEEELQVALFIWVTFFGGSAAFRRHGHVEITMIYDILPKKIQKVLSVMIYCSVVFALFYLFLKSLDMVMMFAQTNKSTSVLSIPCSFLYGAVPVCCILMIINYTIASLPAFKEMFAKQEEKK